MPPKRRRRFQGLYYHSSPPKVLPMNGQIANSNGRRRREPDDFSVKLSTIRIWMHEKDIGKLTRVLWAGQGNRLRQQASTNPKVKRFLAAVPYVMNSIKDVHQAVIDNSLETLQSNLEPPVPPALVTCRDANGLNLIHKAAGLGHATILEYLITTWPDGVHETDITGKTPLHWAASAKNNMRCYTLLTQAGADEEAVDYKMKTPSFYRHKPNEIERAFLTYVPEAPRVSPDVSTDWEALSDDSGDGKKLDIKIPEMNGFGRHSNAESNENTSEAEMTEPASGQDDEEMSKDGDAIDENDQGPDEDNNKEEEEKHEETDHQQEENNEQTEEEATEQQEEKETIEEPTEEAETKTDEIQEKEEDKQEDEQEMPQEEKEPQEEEDKTNESTEQKTEDQNEKQQPQLLQTDNQNDITEKLIKDSDKDETTKESNSNEVTNESPESAVEKTENENGKDFDEISNATEKSEIKDSNESNEQNSADNASKESEELKDNKKEDDKESKNKENGEHVETTESKDEEESKELVKENGTEATTDNESNESKEAITNEQQHSSDKEKENEMKTDEKQTEQEVKAQQIEQKLPKDDKAEASEIVKDTEEHKEQQHLNETVKNDDSQETTTDEKQMEQKDEEHKTHDDDKAVDSEAIKAVEEPKSKEESKQENKIDDNTAVQSEEIKATEEPKSKEESKQETKIDGDTAAQSEAIKVAEENQNANVKDDKKTDEEDKEEAEKEENYKTVGEALENIKEEVKDNVEYLANQIKNVFKDNKTEANDKKGEKDEKDEKEKSKEDENFKDTKQTDTLEGEEPKKENELEKPTTEDKGKALKEENRLEDHTTDEKDSESKEKHEKSAEHINETPYQFTPHQFTPQAPLQDSKTNQTTTENEINPLSAKDDKPSSSTKDLSPKETAKTEEDENNNSKDKVTPTQHVDITDSELQELDKALEEYQKAEKEEEQKLSTTIGNKIEEITDTVKENVQDMADKIKNVFTTDNKDIDKLENKSNDVVVMPAVNSQKLNGLKSVEKSLEESSDETGDEDEEPQDKTENSAENAKESENNGEEQNKIENETTKEKEEDKEPEVETEAEPKEDDNQATNEDHKNERESTEDEERADGDGSPTSSLAIEGYVLGDAETDNTVQSQTAAFDDDENDDDKAARIQSIIAMGDMEQLAQIVLNGDGQKLYNVEATEPEIQAFLRNVPNYMNKIRRVHEAARDGSLLNLQQALDRRKFAIAKDEISPNGATPLHVAVLFGHSDIVRYLSARFPETTTATDNNGRTPLHYAAVVSDNGHFYNVLLQLGANPKLGDKLGHTAEDYLNKAELKDALSYGQLLKNFGAEELEQQLLSDQGQIENHRYEENPIFKTEQGKYLADNLADPLIKALTQVAQKRPNDPLQYLTNYLQNYVATRHTNGRTITQAAVHTGSSSDTNSTAFANSKHATPPPPQHQMQMQMKQPLHMMNGHARHDTDTDNINEEQDAIKRIEEFNDTAAGDDDDGNDSEAEISKKLEERDEHGQSMLHFACARSHRKGGLIHLIEESKADITYRDELYRTARDIALQANQLGNAKEIDRYVLSLAIVGDIKPFEYLAISGYDHIIDILDDNEKPIIDVVESRGNTELAQHLRSIRPLEELREELHQMIRDNNVERVKEIANGPSGRWLIKAKNYYGRTALHIAILKESVEIVELFVSLAPEALKIGDNLERTPLHYAMGTNIIENISHTLIQNGAKRTYKDLKGRQPSYYFMNKADILRLQEEEDENR